MSLKAQGMAHVSCAADVLSGILFITGPKILHRLLAQPGTPAQKYEVRVFLPTSWLQITDKFRNLWKCNIMLNNWIIS